MRGAIETVYNGLRFRSRLEARWAVFFDAMEVEYEYEKQGYEAYGYRYLPDFYLPKLKCFAEVKGGSESLDADRQKLIALLDHASPLPHIANSDEDDERDGGLILLGDVPHVEFGRVFHPIIRHKEGLWLRWVEFFSLPPTGAVNLSLATKQDAMWITCITGTNVCSRADALVEPWTNDAVVVPLRKAFSRVVNAYHAARQARFEFGEQGAVAR